ncbi:hypothetical protein CL656_01120 [bacterium]|nr:hypothetical protein [bacterium]|tara:strand:- start:681 stop:2072 length:1392 start_codon:yes stop_codon:yes gene_type:complete
MIKRILSSICILSLTVFINLNNSSNLGINSINALRNQDKEIELKYEDKSVKVNIKTLRNTKKLSRVLNTNIFTESKLETIKKAKVIKEKNRYKAIQGEEKRTIDMNHLVLASLVSDSVDLKLKSENPDFTLDDAQEMADKLNKIKRQTLRIINNGKLNTVEYEALNLFNESSNTISHKTLKDLLNNYENDIENLTSHVYINSGSGQSHGFLRDGKKINYEKTSQKLKENIDKGLLRIEIIYDIDKGLVFDENGKSYKYEKQGEGKSNFKGSDWGRSQNVELGTQNLISNVFVMPSEQVSFLKILRDKGSQIPWRLAKVIKEGGKLELEPGGGLCQVSTTLFRAALQSGMNIDQWRNHSLYVSYYKEYNNGLDSTIYPPYVDLKFTNPYNFPVLFQSYTNDNKDVITEIYSPEKLPEIELLGPFYKGDKEGLRSNQILWERNIKKIFNTKSEIFKSTYNTSVSR